MTKYGLWQVVLYPAVLLLLMAVWGLFFRQVMPEGWHSGVGLWLAGVLPEAILLAVLGWTLSFFRDPLRQPPEDASLLLAPADGTISDIEEVYEPSIDEGKVLRIGIFLSIFNVHINRMPCAVLVEKITYHPGKFKNAMNPQCGKTNESNDLLLERTARPHDRLLVRQISGAIARRIVCRAAEEQIFAAGQAFGMIKFGSRTELYVPRHDRIKCLVKKGDKVRAGESPLIRYIG